MLAIELDEAEIVEAMIGSTHHNVDWAATCLEKHTNKRVDISMIISNWQSKKVLKLLSERYPTQ
ncbi:hypothetical protein GCM10009332_01840 [Shewanella gelidii]|uniref:Uncharacterized protein n=1 Tax=Shewanella gelidii TaxID=1642821 RepID=A0A917N6D4_9GAMM|nr:hypothetical protein GCM10009332_01840 [Shewanella gelidii]